MAARRRQALSVCPVCRRSIAVTAAGFVRVHGPVGDRCAGSREVPCHDPCLATDVASSHAVAGAAVTSHSASSQVLSSPSPSEGLPELVLSCRPDHSVRILKRVPRASRQQAASKLACIVQDVVDLNTVEAWVRLMKFSRRCLARPSRGGHRRSLATAVNRQLREEADLVLPPGAPKRPPLLAAGDPLSTHPIMLTRVFSFWC